MSNDRKQILAQTEARLARAIELLERSLSQWEDEEDSVQEEHAELIADLNKFFDLERKLDAS